MGIGYQTIGTTMTTNSDKGEGWVKANIFNILTIVFVVLGVAFNYGITHEKVSSLDERLQQETIDRKVEDVRLQLQIDQAHEENVKGHKSILKSLEIIQNNMNFHLGLHAGREDVEE